MDSAVDRIRYSPCANAIQRGSYDGQDKDNVQDIVDDGYHGMEGSFIFGNMLAMWLKVYVYVLLRDQKMTF
ncbi:hypothetical protein J28TS4_33270 [Paenibacillus lautus]|nr:hypothetical protein J28TS4_33270 [Paenibacillus lautus]